MSREFDFKRPLPRAGKERRFTKQTEIDLLKKAKLDFAGGNAEDQQWFDMFGEVYMRYRYGQKGYTRRQVLDAAEKIYCQYGGEKEYGDEAARRLIERMCQAVDNVVWVFEGTDHQLSCPMQTPMAYEPSENGEPGPYVKLQEQIAFLARDMTEKAVAKIEYGDQKPMPKARKERIASLIEDLAGVYAGYRCGHMVEKDVRDIEKELIDTDAADIFAGQLLAKEVYKMVDGQVDLALGINTSRKPMRW